MAPTQSEDFLSHTTLGRTGIQTSRIGLAAGYGISEHATEMAFEKYNVNYFHWETRKAGMGNAVKKLAKSQREKMVIVVQTYDHSGLWLRRSVEKALRSLSIDYADILFLGWVNRMPWRRVLNAANSLKDEGKVRFLGFTGHKRLFHGEMASSTDSPFDVHQIRYSAAHRGAEQDVFARLGENRPGITTYTATRWGRLLRAKKMPPGETPLTAAECYRFALSNSAVDVCLAGPRTEREMIDGLSALTDGPLDPQELARIHKIGDFVHG